MSKKKIVGTVIFLVGIGLIGTSMYIDSQVAQGKLKVNKAQSQVDKGSSLFSGNPIAKGIGSELTGSAQKKINEGKQQITSWEGIAKMAQISGILFAVLGLGVIFIGNKSKR